MTGEALRYLVVLLAAPLWYPFMKAIWREMNRSLADEGGILGTWKEANAPDGTPLESNLESWVSVRRDGVQEGADAGTQRDASASAPRRGFR